MAWIHQTIRRPEFHVAAQHSRLVFCTTRRFAARLSSARTSQVPDGTGAGHANRFSRKEMHKCG